MMQLLDKTFSWKGVYRNDESKQESREQHKILTEQRQNVTVT